VGFGQRCRVMGCAGPHERARAPSICTYFSAKTQGPPWFGGASEGVGDARKRKV
jgi:hypothetical protein